MPRIVPSSLILFCLCSLPNSVLAAEEQRLQGDPRAVALIESMIERFGGKNVWSRSRTLYVEYDGWRTEPNEPVIERAWRDLRNPRYYVEFEGSSFYTISALSPNDGWVSRDGEVTKYTPERHAASVDRHPFAFYVSFYTFAIADQRLRLELQAPDRVLVKTTDGKERSWWQIDSTGALIKWGAPVPTAATVEYVYGPMRTFGNVNFPAWGASTDGWWRWEYTEIDVSTEPFSVSVAPPDIEE